MSRDYSKLQVFHEADKLAMDLYLITKRFPKEELFGITSQIRRAALSVPTNIVEGSQRNSTNDYLHFLTIALGSLAEVGYLTGFACRLGYIDPKEVEQIITQQKTCIKMLQALINSLKKD
jgi:four helix bundle protein